MLKPILLTTLLFTLMSCNQTNHPQPVNPGATPEARELLETLYELRGKYTLSGQHNYISTGSKYTDMVKKVTGTTPVVWGSDFSWCYQGEHPEEFQHCGPANLSDPGDSAAFTDLTLARAREQMIEEVIQRHSDGHIITLMWHGCFPTEGDCCPGENIWAMENRPDPSTWKELVTGGTALNHAWKKQADKIAGYLRILQENNVPVLWRPYHEMNGVWFWWCNQPGDEGFKQLWIMMYDYFTNVHHLNNLIWVWNPNAPRDIPGDEAFDYELFWPGSEYVDILAADVYHNDYKQSHHDDLLELAGGKLIALGEVGDIPTPEILGQQPYWSWFMPWGWLLFKYAGDDQIRKLYDSGQVLGLEAYRDLDP